MIRYVLCVVLLLSCFNVFADLTESGTIIVEPEPTVEYVFEEINIGKLSKFIEVRNAINSAKNEMTRSIAILGKQLSNVQEKYNIVKDECDVETKELFETLIPTIAQWKEGGSQIVNELNEIWSDYNA